MLIKKDDVNYVNTDRTYCVSKMCPKSGTCDRNYVRMVGLGKVFPKQVWMADLYHRGIECEYYISEVVNNEG